MLNNRINSANSLKTEDDISAPRLLLTACRFLRRTHGVDFPHPNPEACTQDKYAPCGVATFYRHTKPEQTLPLRCGIYLARHTTIIPSVSQPGPVAHQSDNTHTPAMD